MFKSSAIEDTKLRSGISVVIPTFNRKALLEKTLLSLCKQTLNKSYFEIIVIDDGSSDDSDKLVYDFQSRLPIRYFFQEDEGFRVAKARNIGIRNASFSTILFIDSGVVVSSKVLQSHFDIHKIKTNLAIVGLSYGVNEYDTRYAEELEHILEKKSVDGALLELEKIPHLWDCRTNYLKSIDYRLNEINIPWILFWTSHTSVSTALLKLVGGFDEWFHSWGGEDVEIGLRLRQFGCDFELFPGVESIHYPHIRDGEKNRSDSKNNVQYIHQKHKLESTRLLMLMNWEDLIVQ